MGVIPMINPLKSRCTTLTVKVLVAKNWLNCHVAVRHLRNFPKKIPLREGHTAPQDSPVYQLFATTASKLFRLISDLLIRSRRDRFATTGQKNKVKIFSTFLNEQIFHLCSLIKQFALDTS